VGPGYCAGDSNQIKPIQNNSNEFEFKSNPFKLFLSKLHLHKLEKFKIKYCFEGFDERNNFLHRNVSRFEMDFKIKFRESNV
jgi:hypothetical protein